MAGLIEAALATASYLIMALFMAFISAGICAVIVTHLLDLGSKRKTDEWMKEKERNWKAVKTSFNISFLSSFTPPPLHPISCRMVCKIQKSKREGTWKRWSEKKKEKDAIEGVILCLIQHSLPKQLNTGLCLLILESTYFQIHARRRSKAVFREIKFAAESY